MLSWRKNSSTWSKPPSSDMGARALHLAAPTAKAGNITAGASPIILVMSDHLSPAKQINNTEIHELSGLGPDWEPLDEFRSVRREALVEKLFEVSEYLARCYRNRRTGEVIVASLPGEVAKAGLMGTRLSALIGYAEGGGVARLHRAIPPRRAAFEAQWRIPGQGRCRRSASRWPPDARNFAMPCRNPMLNVNGTGHPENGKQFNVWGFHAPGPAGFTFFHIDPSKSRDILQAVSRRGFSGVVGTTPRVSTAVSQQTDAQAAILLGRGEPRRETSSRQLSDAVTCRFGNKLLDKIKVLFRLWHRRKTGRQERWRRHVLCVQQEII